VFIERSINLTSAENNSIDFFWLVDGLAMFGVCDDPLELRVTSEILNRGSGNRVAKK
jgi:hypothetical protein